MKEPRGRSVTEHDMLHKTRTHIQTAQPEKDAHADEYSFVSLLFWQFNYAADIIAKFMAGRLEEG